MHILQVASGSFFSTYGGGQVYVKNLVNEMMREGSTKVSVLSFIETETIQERDDHGCTIYETRELSDQELSVLLKNYSRYDYKYKPLELSPRASEILLSDKWLYVLLFHALNSSQRNRKAEDPHSAILISLLNLFSRYYYALKWQFEIYGIYDVRVEEQLITLRPYINLYKSLYGRPVGFYGGFFDRLLFSLHASNYKNKCVHFNLINLIEQLAGATTNGMCHFKITDSRKTHTPNEYVFSLSDYAHN